MKSSESCLTREINLMNGNDSVILFRDGLLFPYSPTSGTAVTLKTGRREVPGSNPGRACRPSRSEFSVVFSETRVNTG